MTIAENQRLPVRLQTINAVGVAEVLTADGAQNVGTVNAPETVQLIGCLLSGRRYVAVVIKTASPLTVRVQNE